MVPVFLVMILGIIEFSLVLKDQITVSRFSKNAARVASVKGDDADSDYSILQEVKAGSGTLPKSGIQRVVVFEASATVDQPTATCRNGTPSSTAGGRCNVYTGADVQTLTSTDFGCGVAQADRFWCPNTRSISGSSVSYIGVYVQVKHPMATLLFGSSRTVTSANVLRMEPRLA